ncbi:MAG TPA: GNAT family N-acetyltransferase [Bacteroidales bacterium]|nr:GNAT family N-acetyltransferase [Bacteroidales bacterium]
MIPGTVLNISDPIPGNEKMNENFIVRDYVNGDFTEILALWQSLGLGNACRGDNEDVIEDSIRIGGKMLVLEDKLRGIICGTSWMTFDRRRIHLHHFGIRSDYQGKGLARLLLKHSLVFVKEKGFQVKLEVHRTNFRGINLYKSVGFEYLGDYDVYIIRDISVI